MAIIINEMEVVPSAAGGENAPAPGPQPTGGTASAPPPLAPWDIREIRRRQSERQSRVLAH